MRLEIPEKYLRPVVIGAIVLLAGPEILAASEMLALVELIGAASFIGIYIYAFQFAARRPVTTLRELAHRLEPSLLFIPTWNVTKQMPSMLVHAVPMYTVALVSVVLVSGMIAWHGIQLV